MQNIKNVMLYECKFIYLFSVIHHREECEELRATLTRRHMDEVCLERSEQLRMKDQMDRDQKALDDMYADLWEQDRQAKAAREERESQEQHTRNRETLETLQQQKAALEAKREDQRRLKAEEGRLLVRICFKDPWEMEEGGSVTVCFS